MGALKHGIYPPLCMSCSAETDSDGLCAECWTNTQFIEGNICDCCGTPLPGDDDGIHCDSCLKYPPAWDRGRAAVVYDGGGRRIALALKHGDRLDLAKPSARWMVSNGIDVLNVDIIVPVPLHWSRFLKRRYNQAALLGASVSKITSIKQIPDMLVRHKRTPAQKGLSRSERLENQRGAIKINKRLQPVIKGSNVLLIDDVMTTGATLSACAEACKEAGSADVNVLVFARVARA